MYWVREWKMAPRNTWKLCKLWDTMTMMTVKEKPIRKCYYCSVFVYRRCECIAALHFVCIFHIEIFIACRRLFGVWTMDAYRNVHIYNSHLHTHTGRILNLNCSPSTRTSFRKTNVSRLWQIDRSTTTQNWYECARQLTLNNVIRIYKKRMQLHIRHIQFVYKRNRSANVIIMLDTFSKMKTRVKLPSNKRARIYVSYECICRYGEWIGSGMKENTFSQKTPPFTSLFDYVTNVLLAYLKTEQQKNKLTHNFRNISLGVYIQLKIKSEFFAISQLKYRFHTFQLSRLLSWNYWLRGFLKTEYLMKPVFHLKLLFALEYNFNDGNTDQINRFRVEK